MVELVPADARLTRAANLHRGDDRPRVWWLAAHGRLGANVARAWVHDDFDATAALCANPWIDEALWCALYRRVAWPCRVDLLRGRTLSPRQRTAAVAVERVSAPVLRLAHQLSDNELDILAGRRGLQPAARRRSS